MIGHQTVRKHSQAVGRRVLGKQSEVSPAQGVRGKDILSRIPALRYMVWQTYCYHPRFPRHAELVQVRQELSQQFGTVSSVPLRGTEQPRATSGPRCALPERGGGPGPGFRRPFAWRRRRP